MANEIPGNVDLERIVGDTEITGAMTFVSGSTLTLAAGATISVPALSSLGITTTAGFVADGGAITLNKDSNFAVEVATGTSTGAVSIATGATAQTIDIANGAGAKTVSIGSTNTTSATTINGGSGDVNIAAGSNDFNITAATTAVTGAATISSTLGVTGKTTLTGGLALPATMVGTTGVPTAGAITVATAAAVTGAKIFGTFVTINTTTTPTSGFYIDNIVSGVSFDVTFVKADGTTNTDDATSTINWFIVTP